MNGAAASRRVGMSIATTTRITWRREDRTSTADLSVTTTKDQGSDSALALAIAGDKCGNSQAQEPAAPGGFFLRQPLLSDPRAERGQQPATSASSRPVLTRWQRAEGLR